MRARWVLGAVAVAALAACGPSGGSAAPTTTGGPSAAGTAEPDAPPGAPPTAGAGEAVPTTDPGVRSDPTPSGGTAEPGDGPAPGPPEAIHGFEGTIHERGNRPSEIPEDPNPTYDRRGRTFTRAGVVPTGVGWDVHWGTYAVPVPGTFSGYVGRYRGDGALMGWDQKTYAATLDPDPTDEPVEPGCRFDPPLALPTAVGERLERTVECGGSGHLVVEVTGTEVLTIEGRTFATVIRDGSISGRQPVDEEGGRGNTGSATWREWYAPALGIPVRWEMVSEARVDPGILDPEEVWSATDASFTITFRPLPSE